MRENDLKTAVQAWIRAGAEVSTGLLLLSQCSTNTRIPVMIRRNPTKYRPLLLERLCAAAGIELPRTEPAPTDRRRFRDDFPFLRDSDCPQELKILAADKITAREHYVRAHDRLFDCTTLAECFHTAREAIVNFQENRAIFAELDYYREHRTILGKHRIFEHLRRQQQLHKLNIVELLAEQRRLKSAIWRIDDEIKKGDKPHLLTAREQRKRQKQLLLDEVNKHIEAYEHGR